MKESRPADHPTAFEGSAAPEPDLTEPEDLIAALEAWDPDASAAPEVDAAEEEMEHVHVVARHPNEPWVIVQGWDRDNRSHAWVRHAVTHTILWEPEGAILMTWLRQGQEIGLIGETFTPDPHKPAVIGSHLQSEFGYWFERWSWPDRQRIGHCSIGMRTGWPTALLETPDPHLAFFEWYDQGEAGYEGIMLDNFQGDKQDPQESYEIGVPLIGHHGQLVFSADARYLVRWHALPFADNATAPGSEQYSLPTSPSLIAGSPRCATFPSIARCRRVGSCRRSSLASSLANNRAKHLIPTSFGSNHAPLWMMSIWCPR